MPLVNGESLDSNQADSVLHISERYRHQSERRTLEEPLAFERMVCELLVEFTNLRAADVEGAITAAERRIVDAADVDGMAVFELTADGNDVALTHAWTRRGDDAPARIASARQLFPWTHAHAPDSTGACFS